MAEFPINQRCLSCAADMNPAEKNNYPQGLPNSLPVF